MASRRTRLSAASLVVAAAIGGVRMAAHGQDWTINAGLSDQEEVTNNVLFAPTDRRSDLITTLTPSLNISGASNRLSGTFNYSPSLYLYALMPEQDQVGQNLYANGTATVVRDTLFLDARGYMSLVPSAPGLATPGVGSLPSFPGLGIGQIAPQGLPKSQLTQTMSFSASPYLVHRFDGYGTGELRYTLTNTDLTGGTGLLGNALPSSQTTTNEATAAFLTGERFGPFVARLVLDDAQSSGTGSLAGAKQQEEIIDSAYAVTSRVSLLATIGHEDISYAGIPPIRINDIVWGTGLQLTPSPDATINLSYGHRDGTTSPSIAITYNPTATTTVTATYSTGISSTAQDIANNLAVSGVNQQGQLIDTRTLLPLSLVNPTLGVQAGIFRTQQLAATGAINLERNHLSASIYRSENQLLSQSSPGSAASQNAIGGTINWGREINPLTTGNINLGYSRSTFPTLGIASEADTLTIGASISYTLTATLSAWAGYNRVARTSPDPALRVSADMIFAGLSKSF
jgi:uncharacterized protein (PEP-CTERM system associated)